jgi:hypothetical protein
MTIRQLALYVMKVKGLDQGDKVLVKSAGLRLIHALRMHDAAAEDGGEGLLPLNRW